VPKKSESKPSRKKVRRPSLFRRMESALELGGGVELVLPYPLLPSRWRKQCERHNLLLCLTPSLEIEIKREGKGFQAVRRLRKAEARKLLLEIGEALQGYARQLRPFSRFLDKWAEEPSKERYYGKRTEEEKTPGATEIRAQKAQEPAAAGQETELDWVEEVHPAFRQAWKALNCRPRLPRAGEVPANEAGDSPYPNCDY